MGDQEERWRRVGDAIAERVAKLKLTKAELIRASGVSDKTLNGYLAGQPIKRADKARELCAALGWTPDSIDRLLAGKPAIVAADLEGVQQVLATAQEDLDQVLAELSDARFVDDDGALVSDDRLEILREEYAARVDVARRLLDRIENGPRPRSPEEEDRMRFAGIVSELSWAAYQLPRGRRDRLIADWRRQLVVERAAVAAEDHNAAFAAEHGEFGGDERPDRRSQPVDAEATPEGYD